jgi:hypothetical protein
MTSTGKFDSPQSPRNRAVDLEENTKMQSTHSNEKSNESLPSQDVRMSPTVTNTSNVNGLTVEVPSKITTPIRCKTCPALLDEKQESWMKQCVGCFKDTTTKRNCSVCERPRIVINDEKWKTVCNGCFKDAALKPCVSCRVPSIKAFETWRTFCKHCYAAKNWKRTCEKCKERPIKDDLPSYVKTCTRCYMNDRMRNFTNCTTCPADKQGLLNCRNGAPMCRDCMRANNLIVDKKSLINGRHQTYTYSVTPTTPPNSPSGVTGMEWGRPILEKARDKIPPAPPPLVRQRAYWSEPMIEHTIDGERKAYSKSKMREEQEAKGHEVLFNDQVKEQRGVEDREFERQLKKQREREGKALERERENIRVQYLA